MSIVLTNISKTYDGRKVLEDINLECKPGEIIGLVGRNGVGKSTLLKIVAGIITDYDGEISNLGIVGYLSERNPMYPQMYVSEYLSWLNQLNSNRQHHNGQLETLVDHLDLRGVGGKKIKTLSKGFRQRVGLAGALLGDPEILILDEPINGLDPVQIQEYRNLIKSYSKNKIVILSSHLMQEIEAICDRVVTLKNGKISSDQYLNQRRNSNCQILRLQLDKDVDVGRLQRIEGVDRIEELGDRILIIECKEGVDIRPLLFDTIVDIGGRILEMRIVEMSDLKSFNPSL